MRLRIGSVLVALATVVWMTTVCLAQADNTSSPTDEAAQVETTAAPPDMDQAAVISELFLTLVSPADRDVELPLETAQLRIHGATLPGAVVSIDGDLVDRDDQGTFDAVTSVDEGASEIEIIASDDQGNQVNTTIFVSRGD